jgi:cobalt-zinc-cadmium resistance protein CzcA
VHAIDVAVNLQAHYIRMYDQRVSELMNGIRKYEESIRYYDQSGRQLARELSDYAEKGYAAGEIDFFRFVQSMDNAIAIELGYLDTLFEYNKLVLKVNLLTL